MLNLENEIILASSSPRRRDLLKQIGLKFKRCKVSNEKF